MALLFLKIIVALALLWVGAEALVRGASALALRLKISELAIGLTVVAFGTSAPELVVSLGSASAGAGDIAVGNVVGSNICNIALILGLAALVRPVEVEAKIFRLDGPLLVAVSAALALLLFTGGVSRWAGLLLLAGLIAYTALTMWAARREKTAVREEFAEGLSAPDRRLVFDLLLVATGLIGLVAGGKLLVDSAVALSTAWGVSQAVVGLTVVAVGTSLPELATSLVAAFRGQGNLAVGNVVGSNLFNILGILGVTAAVHPLSRGGITNLDLAVMLLLSIVLLPIVRTGFVVSRMEGGFLLAVYVVYTIWLVSF